MLVIVVFNVFRPFARSTTRRHVLRLFTYRIKVQKVIRRDTSKTRVEYLEIFVEFPKNLYLSIDLETFSFRSKRRQRTIRTRDHLVYSLVRILPSRLRSRFSFKIDRNARKMPPRLAYLKIQPSSVIFYRKI